jgi:hypothetical protein
MCGIRHSYCPKPCSRRKGKTGSRTNSWPRCRTSCANLLNAIVGWVNLLQSGSLDAAGSKRALETIERNVHLQVSLIDESWICHGS